MCLLDTIVALWSRHTRFGNIHHMTCHRWTVLCLMLQCLSCNRLCISFHNHKLHLKKEKKNQMKLWEGFLWKKKAFFYRALIRVKPYPTLVYETYPLYQKHHFRHRRSHEPATNQQKLSWSSWRTLWRRSLWSKESKSLSFFLQFLRCF